MGCVDIETNQGTGSTQPNNAPVVGGIMATRLPARIESAIGTELTLEANRGFYENKIVGAGKEVIRDCQDTGTDGNTGKLSCMQEGVHYGQLTRIFGQLGNLGPMRLKWIGPTAGI